MPNLQDASSSFGIKIGFIYIFNLIVGSGALTMPKAFNNSGIILSSIMLVFLTFMSFITATFMFEAMAISNAIKRYQKQTRESEQYSYVNPLSESSQPSVGDSSGVRVKRSIGSAAAGVSSSQQDDLNESSEDKPLLNVNTENQDFESIMTSTTNQRRNQSNNVWMDDREWLVDGDMERKEIDKLFSIDDKFEMGEMARIYFSKYGQLLFYLAMILYLYGDLAIYDAAVPKSLRDTTCTYQFENTTTSGASNLSESDICWSAIPALSRMNVYRIYVLIFNLTIGALVFFNLQKTKLLQLLTTIMRWTAFIAMISLAFRRIIQNKNSSQLVEQVNFFRVQGVPNFFGVCIYAFMCHHSLPSIITPMRHKEQYKTLFVIVYACIMIFYLLLSYTGVFAFGDKLEDFYTLNFSPRQDERDHASIFMIIIDYYLSLFPVFTISASFPIIGITLRNNLKSLYYFMSNKEPNSSHTSYLFSIGLPLITLIPPMIISLITHDLQLLVGITGSYAGVAIQYVIPSCLVYFARRESVRLFRKNFEQKHSYSSPFAHRYWVFFLLLWSNVSVIFVTVNHILSKS